jgi:hypothetical protein
MTIAMKQIDQAIKTIVASDIFSYLFNILGKSSQDLCRLSTRTFVLMGGSAVFFAVK